MHRTVRTSRFFFFNDTATTEIYTLSLHDALPIFATTWSRWATTSAHSTWTWRCRRSEEHTSELQSRQYLVCRLLLEKKKTLSSRSLPSHPLPPQLPLCLPSHLSVPIGVASPLPLG